MSSSDSGKRKWFLNFFIVSLTLTLTLTTFSSSRTSFHSLKIHNINDSGIYQLKICITDKMNYFANLNMKYLKCTKHLVNCLCKDRNLLRLVHILKINFAWNHFNNFCILWHFSGVRWSLHSR